MPIGNNIHNPGYIKIFEFHEDIEIAVNITDI